MSSELLTLLMFVTLIVGISPDIRWPLLWPLSPLCSA